MSGHPETPQGCRLIVRDSVRSTSEEARRLAADGAPAWTVVWAREQTSGKGRHGRAWDSPRGNLYLSIVLRPGCGVAAAPQVGFAVGVAMARAIRERSGADVELKWPNDLLLGGRKISGLLLESSGAGGRLDWVVAGIGVNVGSRPDLPGAGSLRDAGYDVAVPALLETFLVRLSELLEIWERDGFAPVRALWSALATAPDTPLTVRLPDGARSGRFGGIDDAGNMILATPDGPLQVAAGDVFPLSTIPAGVA